MCQMCEAFGLKTESVDAGKEQRGSAHVTRNDDGTYSLRLTETELKNLTLRLALSVLQDRQF